MKKRINFCLLLVFSCLPDLEGEGGKRVGGGGVGVVSFTALSSS